MRKIWVENFHWDVVSACDTAGTSCCSVFIETLGLDFLSKLIRISKFKFQNFDFPHWLKFDKKNLNVEKTLAKSENGIFPKPQ